MIPRFSLGQKVIGLLSGLLMLVVGLGLLLVTYDPSISSYQASAPVLGNQYPHFLVAIGSIVLRYLGSAAWLWYVACGFVLLARFFHIGRMQIAFGFGCVAAAWMLYGALFGYLVWGDPWYGGVAWMAPGGLIGCFCAAELLQYFDVLGLLIGVFLLALSGVLLIVGFRGVACIGVLGIWGFKPVVALCSSAFRWFIRQMHRSIVLKRLNRIGKQAFGMRAATEPSDLVDLDFWRHFAEQPDEDAGVARALDVQAAQNVDSEEEETFVLPGRHLFTEPPKKQERQARVNREIETRIAFLEDKLCRFGVQGSVVHSEVGPVVTLFEYAPAPDVKVSRISALADDVALALGALSLRVISPMPGKQVVGFEVANEQRQTVYFSELFDSETYRNFSGALPAVIGARSNGVPCILDLAQQPHMLIAGSTGSGKSVVMHALLLGLLGAKSPDEMRLIMIDPKRLEFSPYADIPHLMLPIVTEVAEIAKVFAWLVTIMEGRYAELAQAGVRSVEEYRARKGSDAMPYIVVVVDELADIMVTVGREVEPLLVRLAQMARAAAIHLVVATQRPSVDVVTGILKVNFPTRIALKVASKVDSRTVIDMPGAEQLLGKGDMLLMQQGGAVERAHGAFVQSKEVHAVASYLRMQQKPVYEVLTAPSSGGGTLVGTDALYSEVLAFVRSRQEVSISLLQRHFRIGFNRSARLIDQLEGDGFISSAGSGKMRKVL